MSRLSYFRLFAGLMVCFAAMAMATPNVSAQVQRLGYTIKYQDAWPVTNQIKFVRVTIKPIAGTSADNVDFYAVASTTGNNFGLTVSTRISIRKGDTSAVGELYVPVGNGYSFAIHTETDGNLRIDRRDYAKRNYYDYSANQLSPSAGQPSFIFASSEVIADEGFEFTAMSRNVAPQLQSFTSVATSSDFPALNDLDEWYQTSNAGFGGGRTSMTINGFASPKVAAMSLESLPSRWFGYEGLGLVMITYDDLKLLSKNHPGKLLAIERWVAASGRLVVLNCGNRLEKADETLRLLGDSDANTRANRNCQYLSKQPTDAEIDRARVVALGTNPGSINYRPRGMSVRVKSVSDESDSLDLWPTNESGKFGNAIETDLGKDMLAIDFELGQVICLTDEASDWSNGKPSGDRWGVVGMFLNAARTSTLPHQIYNSDTLRSIGFPEFDEPPRYVFEMSILLYLLVIGPFTFFVLKRKHKLNLMFVVVPIISTIFCTVILAYAIFAEGFDTRVNLFTFTELNQKTGRQTTSALAHVYSGMTPSPYVLEGANYGMVNLGRGGRMQRIKWNGGSEEMSGGEIRARTSHQIASRSSDESDSKLVFSVSGSGNSVTASVRNEFDKTIRAVAFTTDDCKRNEVWLCQNVEAGATVAAVKTDMAGAASKFRLAIRQLGQTTVLASGKSTEQRDNYRNRYNYGVKITSAESTSVASRLKTCWNMSDQTIKRFLTSDGKDRYLAITDGSVSYKLPVSNAKVETGIHIVSGVR